MPEQMSQKEYWGGKVGDEWAAHADSIDAMLHDMSQSALDAADLRPGERVLDIGCGAGGVSMEIARRVSPGGTVVGVDISPQLLAAARARAGDLPVQFREADAGADDLGPAFDAAFSRFGIMFFENPTRAFAHIRSSLREQGRLVFVCWRQMAENTWTTLPVEAIAPMFTAPLARPDPDAPGPFAFADPKKIERILADAGWSDIAITTWDGAISVGGGGAIEDIAEFLLRIGPCARAITDQALDRVEAKARLVERLGPIYAEGAVKLAAACWIVSAKA